MYTNQKCKHFKLYELLPKEMYIDEEHGWDKIDDQLKTTIDFLRELFGVPLIINTWHSKGDRNLSGLRPKDCQIGASHSAHKMGLAADIISHYMDARTMRSVIHHNEDKLPNKIRLEADVTWLHVDVRTNGQTKKVYEFKA